MAILSKIRSAAFLVMLLTAALTPGVPLSADEDGCNDYGDCEFCESGNICVVDLNQRCSSWEGCEQVGFCEPGGAICSCSPCN